MKSLIFYISIICFYLRVPAMKYEVVCNRLILTIYQALIMLSVVVRLWLNDHLLPPLYLCKKNIPRFARKAGRVDSLQIHRVYPKVSGQDCIVASPERKS